MQLDLPTYLPKNLMSYVNAPLVKTSSISYDNEKISSIYDNGEIIRKQ